MPEQKRPNRLAELLKERNGFIAIPEALKILGPEEYTNCLVELHEKEEDDPEHINLFFQNGDSEKLDGKPTHICFSDAAMDWFCQLLDNAIESTGHLSPRNKGLSVN